MSILLAILKIIGIVLLVVIGIVVFFILLILFCPICYRIKADHNEENTNVDLKIRYLFVKSVATFVKDEGLKYKVKFLFFTLLNSEDKKDVPDDEDGIDVMDLDPNDDFSENGFFDEPANVVSDQPANMVSSEASDEASNEADIQSDASELPAEEVIDTFTSVTESEGFSELTKKEQKKLLRAEKKRLKAEKKRLKEEKKQAKGDESVLDKIDEKLEKIGIKMDKLSKKYDEIAKKIDHIEQFIEKPFVQKTFKRAFKIIKRLFGTIKPKKSKGYLRFGLSSAASTGEMLGRLARIYPLYGRWLEIEPDFYHKVIEGNVDIKGRIYLFRIVGPALRLLISRDFWRTYKLAKKI
ncbi:MAG: DUF2953 domain-containing protein [Eubacterium sp.]|nr:DUF2953 domain-containing protein [Eubacterium sp.]